MSVQSLTLSSALTEPAPVRRRAAEPDSGRAAEAFTLPDDPSRETASRAQDASAPRPKPERAQTEDQSSPQKPDAKTNATQTSEDKAIEDKASAGRTDAAKTDTTKTDAVKTDAAKTNAATPAPIAVKPGETTPGAQAATASPPVQQDVGALVSIAVATQAEAQTGGDGVKEKDAEGPKDKAAETPAADASALPTTPAEGVVVLALPTIDLSAALVPAAVPAAATEAAAPAAGAVPTAGIAKAGLASPKSAVAAFLQGDAAVGGAGADVGAPANGEGGKAQLAIGGQQTAHAAKTAKEEPAASSTAPAAPQADFKPLELLQTPQNLVDLSALAQPRAGKTGAAADLATPEQTAAGQATTAHGQAAAATQTTPLHMVPIEIGMKALAGSRSFDIRLDPAELGRVDVKLEVSDKGEVSARLVVDRVETLHMLQRDSRTLERAFEQAGLKPSDAGVDISLRDPADQSGFRQNRQQDDAPRRPPTVSETGEDIVAPAKPIQTRRLVRLGGVDLSI
ncbi:flagellar hook-length control protein FliK [Bosea psychrotolerans]|uniref:Flagellar hook-length control protein FliK n=1 Tax=Bosea psychrotolerans TaxID=1871628 RepID=A0A2S4MPB6_9HYPH|nr:flagellar hook-length control protein FliK [Bosea psychrotolerans]POR56602.1 flagellar hook-length control protein FliK [Bosea psychrotolerans]